MQTNRKSYNITKPLVIKWITKDKKGTWDEIRISQTRWNEEYDNAVNVDWACSYALSFKCRLNARVKYFQYQVLHRTLVTNKNYNNLIS